MKKKHLFTKKTFVQNRLIDMGKSQRQLADYLEMDTASLSKALDNKRKFIWHEAQLMAYFLGCSMADLGFVI